MDLVDSASIIDATAQYPTWIQRRPQAVAEWDWSRNDPSSDPWGASGWSKKAWWVCDVGHSCALRSEVAGGGLPLLRRSSPSGPATTIYEHAIRRRRRVG